MDQQQAVEIATQVATGLSAAHQQQLVHRDIKPANLWICDADSQLKILDFGLARIGDDDPGLTATGMLAGTPSFMSPEQTRGQELDGRSDLFSLGCVLYRLLTGKLPFGAPTVLATLQAIQNNQPTPPIELRPDVSQDLSDLTMCLLEKLPADRPSSANQTIELLSSPRERWSVAIPMYAQPSPAGVNQLPKVADINNAGGRWRRWFATGIALMLLGTVGWFWAPQIFRVVTDQGEIVIETTDDDVEVQVLQAGKVIRVIDTKTQQSFDLKSGQYSFKAVADENAESQNSFTIAPETLTMKRGETAIVKVTVATQQETALDSAAPEDSSSSSKTAGKVYKGQGFAHWLNVVKVELDKKLLANALTAAAATRSSKEETSQLFAAISNLVRQAKPNMSRDFERMIDDHPIYLYVFSTLQKFGKEEVLDFLAAEITSGTQFSRSFCGYFIFRDGREVEPTAILDELSQDTLLEVAARHIKEPGNERVLGAMLDSRRAPLERWKQELLKLRIDEKIRPRILTANIESRNHLLPLVVATLPEDEEVYRLYEGDLLKGQATNLQRGRIYDRVLSRNPEQLPEHKALTILKCLEDPAIRESLRHPTRGSSSHLQRSSRNLLWPLEALVPFLDSTTQDVIKSRLTNLEDAFAVTPSSDHVPRQENAIFQRLLGKQKPAQTSLSVAKMPTSSSSRPKRARSIPSVDKPFFKGRTFREWMRTAKLDRDPKLRTEAMVACTATAENDDEWQQLTDANTETSAKVWNRYSRRRQRRKIPQRIYACAR